MLDHDAADDPLASCFDDPIAHMEPVEEYDETQEQRERRIEREAYRDAAIRFISFIHSAFAFIHSAGNDSERAVRLWAVSSTINHPACDGRADTELARNLGTTRANFSKHKLAFQRQNSLPPTLSQKSPEARNSYRIARKAQLSE